MKVRTSISLSKNLLQQMDRLPRRPPRSEIIENALRLYFKNLQMNQRNKRDQELIDLHSTELNFEANDVLKYQKR